MHSYDTKNYIFHFDGGVENGDVIIYEKETKTEMKLNANEILEFVAYNYIMPKRIREIENMNWKELFK